MKSRAVILMLLGMLLVSIGIAACATYFIWRFRGPIPKAHSDVPIKHLVFSFSKNPPEILEISASIPRPINVGIPPATEFVLRCRIRCLLRGTPGNRPMIESAESSYRCVKRGDLNEASIANVLFTPITKTVVDAQYSGEPIEITVNLEEVVSTMAFGRNRYEIQVGNKQTQVELFHDKGGS